MTLCDCCMNKVYWVGNRGTWYCSERTRESFVACNEWTDYCGFRPNVGMKYSREEIIAKWRKHVSKMSEDKND